MKKLQKVMLTLFAAMVMILAVKVPAKAYTSLNFKESTCSANSITFSWNSQNETETSYYSSYTRTKYTIVSYYKIQSADGLYSATVAGTATSATISGLPTNYGGKFTITYPYSNVYYYKYSSGSTSNSTYSYTGESYTYANTLPSTPSKKNFAISSVLYSTKKFMVQVAKPSIDGVTTGFVLQVFKGSKKVGTYTSSSSYSSYIGVSSNATYSYRIRYYFKNASNSQTYYGNWSPYRRFDLASMKSIAKSNKKGCTVTLYKASGVTHYAVYISTTSNKSGFKKYGTYKMGSKSKKITINKKYKKKKTNYIKIVPYIKGYGWSDIYTVYYQYIYK